MGRLKNIERGRQYWELYRQGLSTNQIGQMLGVAGASVWQVLKRHGYATRPRPTAPVIIEHAGVRFAPDKDGYFRPAGAAARRAGTPRLHQLIWQEAHGPIPPGHVLTFRDGDRANCRLDNLELVTRREIRRRSRRDVEPKPCAVCGAMMTPHEHGGRGGRKGGPGREHPCAFASRQTCGMACAVVLKRGRTCRSTRPAYRAPKVVTPDHKGKAIQSARRRAAHQDPRHHLGLVYMAAGRLGNVLGCDPNELIGDSYIAMTDAVRTWNPDKGFTFATHATTALKFRLYGAEMKARGRVRVGDKGHRWSDPLGLKFQGENFERMHGRWSDDDTLPAREARTLDGLQRAVDQAEAIVPGRGGEIMRLLARGLSQRQVGMALGVSRAYINRVFNQILEGLRSEAGGAKSQEGAA